MIDAKYAAGFFDGEGSINVCIRTDKRTGRPSIGWRVQTTQVTQRREVLEQLADRWGGGLYDYDYSAKTPNRQPASTWSVNSKGEILLFLQDVYPYLIVKKTEAAYMMLGLREELTPQETRDFIHQERKPLLAVRRG